jgi:hypothetical protein
VAAETIARGGSARRRDAGRVRIGLILGLAVVAVAVYGGVQLAQHYWAYWNMSEEANRVATDLVAGQVQQEGARKLIRSRAAEFGLQFEDKDIQITIEPRVASISFEWQRSVDLPWYTVPLAFQVNAVSRRTR